jgi:hypothetical protein
MHIKELLRSGILMGISFSVMLALTVPLSARADNDESIDPQLYNENIETIHIENVDEYLFDRDLDLSKGSGIIDLRPHTAVGPPQRLALDMYNPLDVPVQVTIPGLEISFLVEPNTLRTYEMPMLQVGTHSTLPYLVETLPTAQVAVVDNTSILSLIDTNTSYVVEEDPEPEYYTRVETESAVRGYW